MCGVCVNDGSGPADDYYFNPDAQTCDACGDLENLSSLLVNSPTLLTFSAILIVVLIISMKYALYTDVRTLDTKV